MVTSKRNKSDSGLMGKGHRYWSIMLVGEHGRVIPFRRFKEIAIAVIALACLSIGALAVIGYLYAQQAGTIASLQRELDGLKRQTAQLKDEKDVLHTKLVIYEMQKRPEAAASPKTKEVVQSPQKPGPSVAPAPMPQESQPPAVASAPPQPIAAATPTSTPSVNWVVELQQFEAEFDAPRELIKFSLRVVNKTVRNAFAGRIVLVIKQAGASPSSWVSLPNVPLVQGKPSGTNGQAFSVQNYRTMDFKLYKQRPPVLYDTATAFVFLSSGELLLSKDFNFKIEVQQVQPTATHPPPVQAPPASAPTPESAPSVPTATPLAPIVPEPTGGAAGDPGAGGLPGTPGSTPSPAPTQGPPQGPAPSVPSQQAEPKR